ncbi:MAG: hypothetical protein KatS3mg064_1026 [Tepidiforma sp.]|nr:MAG: hypothetical protein KatS3mg064_1026 [Tepidiforma sp.]
MLGGWTAELQQLLKAVEEVVTWCPVYGCPLNRPWGTWERWVLGPGQGMPVFSVMLHGQADHGWGMVEPVRLWLLIQALCPVCLGAKIFPFGYDAAGKPYACPSCAGTGGPVNGRYLMIAPERWEYFYRHVEKDPGYIPEFTEPGRTEYLWVPKLYWPERGEPRGTFQFSD